MYFIKCLVIFFIEQIYENIAYTNQAIELLANQTISKPITVIFQTYLLNLNPTDKVLEIGTGSGFQTCLLAELANQIYTIERQKVLFDQRANYFNDQYFTTIENPQPFNLKSRFSNIEYRWGDGFKGLPGFQPYNKILITCAAPEIPKALIDQLKPNGILVAPIDIVPGKSTEKQIMTRIQKLQNGELQIEKFHEFKFVPMLQGKQ